MKFSSITQALLTSILFVSQANFVEAATVQTFDTDASTTAAGWFGTGNTTDGNNYGFANSDFTAQASPGGEAGGTMIHFTNTSSYGVSLGASFSLSDSFRADGEWASPTFTPEGASIGIGFYNSADIGVTKRINTLGLTVAEPGANGLRIRAAYYLTNGAAVQTATAQVIALGTNKVGRFSFVYDPTLSSGNGSLTVTMYNLGGFSLGSRTVNLTAAQRTTNVFIDSFGIVIGGIPPSLDTNTSTFFIDNVQYYAGPVITCVTPSPSQLITAVGSSNQNVSVTIPTSANLTNDLSVVVTSLNTNVAVPSGADANGKLTLLFASGGTTNMNFTVVGRGLGSTVFTLSNTNGVCVDANVEITVTAAAQPTITNSETFDSAALAACDGWVEFLSRSNGFNFGFTNSQFAGGAAAGEAGGTFSRRTNGAYYGDLFSGALTLNDNISASGKFIMPVLPADNEVRIGHFLTPATPNVNASMIGISIAEPTSLALPGARVRAFFQLGNGAVQYSGTIFRLVLTSQVYNWNYVYDPSGRLVVTFDDGAGGTISLTNTLSLAQRQITTSFNAFGIVQTRNATVNTNDATELYIDDVIYTAPLDLLKITKIENLSATIRLTFTTPSTNATHEISQTDTLTNPIWTPVTGVTFGGDCGKLTAEFAKPISSTEFYRVRLP
ncbi:MAG: hypothetical protein ABI042_09470 [Verrucomicrobiota bacterium]